MADWTDEDEGLLRAYKVRDYLRQHGQFQSLAEPSSYVKQGERPLYLEPGEQCLAITRARLTRQVVYRYVPEDTRYFRLSYSFRKDPLVAPFMWIILLPFNLLSMLISRAVHTKTASNSVVDDGSLIVTNRALRQATYGDHLRFPWVQVSAVDLSYSPPGINLRFRNEDCFIETSAVDRLALILMMRYLALRNRGDDLTVLDSFLDRARALGKL
jgi:hypothetical protein